MGVSQDGLPWYLAIGMTAALSVRCLRVETNINKLLGVPRNHEPLKLQESLSICYLSAALAIYAWIGYSLLHPSSKLARLTQVVDIQLLSERDFQNNHEELPGSQPQEDLRKRLADQVSQTGSLTKTKAIQAEKQPPKKEDAAEHPDKKLAKSNGQAKVERHDEKPAEKPSSPKPVEQELEESKAAPLAIPSSWKTNLVDQHFVPAASKSLSPLRPQNQNLPYMSEVEPPELVELLENDGDAAAMHVFQKGGKSSGGKGAENGLSNYLKELHKRIKNAWTPPMGSTRKVVLQFRLKRDGHVAWVKVTKSSGETETDSSALKAIMQASKEAQALPKDYTAEYLDVEYTFKYNVDELEETKATN